MSGQRVSLWIEAMRLRTLPVSVAGVVAGAGLARDMIPEAGWQWPVICLLFALLAQIASNFANEYFDYKAGIDTADRVGPARGVSLGLISPKAMLRATVLTVAVALATGLMAVPRAGWWLIPVGAFIALGAMAYSAGPWPLSRHRLGEVAVILFFGLIPVSLTYYLIALSLPARVVVASTGVGLMGAMVILVNNYRDIATDREAGKHTLSTLVGPQGSALIYCAMGQIAAVMLLFSATGAGCAGAVIPAALGFLGGFILYRGGLDGPSCTRLLGVTSLLLLATSLLLALL